MEGDFNQLINGKQPVLVDFYATWCGHCKRMAPVVEEVVEEMSDKLAILKMDIDKNQTLAETYQVHGVPTFIVFKNGEVVWRQSGAMEKQQLVDVINTFLG